MAGLSLTLNMYLYQHKVKHVELGTRGYAGSSKNKEYGEDLGIHFGSELGPSGS